jgi:osmotically-inducible protein OsmY
MDERNQTAAEWGSLPRHRRLSRDNAATIRTPNLSGLSNSPRGATGARFFCKGEFMATTTSPPRTDDAIREAVLSELQYDPKITSPDIAVAVKDGVVTLSGYVSSYWEKDAAEKAAKRVYGVKAVANDIEVRLTLQRTDPEIAREAVRELASHIGLPADQIKVTVEKGWITLEGSVEWQNQRELAESAVKKLPGVVGVTNNIEVKPRSAPTDIKSRIEEALKRSAELDARRITVSTEGDVVRLYGTVRSWAEKQEAENAAWSAPGVKRVENYIEVVS